MISPSVKSDLFPVEKILQTSRVSSVVHQKPAELQESLDTILLSPIFKVIDGNPLYNLRYNNASLDTLEKCRDHLLSALRIFNPHDKLQNETFANYVFGNAEKILVISGAEKCSISFDVRPIVYLYRQNLPFWHQDEGKDTLRIIEYFCPSALDERLKELGGTYFIDPEKIANDELSQIRELTKLKNYKQSAMQINDILERNQTAILKPSANLISTFFFDGTIHSAPYVDQALYMKLNVDLLNKILISRYDINLPQNILSESSF